MYQKDFKNTTERMFFKVKAYNICFKASSNGILEGTVDDIKIDEIQKKRNGSVPILQVD
jgi:hypothetical protein